MRIMGIDYGTKRVGIALSDEAGRLAFPEVVLLNNSEMLGKLRELVADGAVGKIVVGESLDFNGQPNSVSLEISKFVSNVELYLKLPVVRQQEFLTTVEARKIGSSKSDLSPSQAHSKVKKVKGLQADASAAALILQRYLDKQNK